jgi:hypothetical protein
MMKLPTINYGLLDRMREAVVVGIIAIFIGLAVYAAIGFAWSFKAAVEASQRLRHPHTP